MSGDKEEKKEELQEIGHYGYTLLEKRIQDIEAGLEGVEKRLGEVIDFLNKMNQPEPQPEPQQPQGMSQQQTGDFVPSQQIPKKEGVLQKLGF